MTVDTTGESTSDPVSDESGNTVDDTTSTPTPSKNEDATPHDAALTEESNGLAQDMPGNSTQIEVSAIV